MRRDTNLTGELDEVDRQILTTLKQIPIEQNIPVIKKIIARKTKVILKRWSTLSKKASGNIDKTPKIHVDEVDRQILTTLKQ